MEPGLETLGTLFHQRPADTCCLAMRAIMKDAARARRHESARRRPPVPAPSHNTHATPLPRLFTLRPFASSSPSSSDRPSRSPWRLEPREVRPELAQLRVRGSCAAAVAPEDRQEEGARPAAPLYARRAAPPPRADDVSSVRAASAVRSRSRASFGGHSASSLSRAGPPRRRATSAASERAVHFRRGRLDVGLLRVQRYRRSGVGRDGRRGSGGGVRLSAPPLASPGAAPGPGTATSSTASSSLFSPASRAGVRHAGVPSWTGLRGSVSMTPSKSTAARRRWRGVESLPSSASISGALLWSMRGCMCFVVRGCPGCPAPRRRRITLIRAVLVRLRLGPLLAAPTSPQPALRST